MKHLAFKREILKYNIQIFVEESSKSVEIVDKEASILSKMIRKAMVSKDFRGNKS